MEPILYGGIFGFVFYFFVRSILNYFTNLELPILPDRYHDNKRLTFIMMSIYMFGFIIGLVFTLVVQN